MEIARTYHDILAIIPPDKKKKLFGFLRKSILFGVLDLLSIAYLIPVLILIFDPEKLNELIIKNTTYSIALDGQAIIIFTVFVLCFFIVKIFFQTRFNTALYVFLYDLSTDLSMVCTKDFLNENYIQFQKENKGKVLQNITTVPENFCSRFLHPVIFLVSEVIVLSVILATLLLLYFKITLLVLLILCLFGIFIYYIQRKQLQVIETTYSITQTKANGHLLNILDGFLEIKSSRNDAYFLENFRKEKSMLNNITAKLISYYFNYSKYLEVCLIVCISSLIFFNFQKGDTIVLISIVGAASIRLIPSISKILNSITMIKTHFYCVEILSKIQPGTKRNDSKIAFKTTIQLQNIDFSYDGNSILKNCNLDINKGNLIGIKGDSGIGKTTLLYIVLGMLKPQNGYYLIDGIPTTGENFLPFANYVPQQPFLFSGSIIENIVMGQDQLNIDHDHIYFLCRKLELHAVIEKLDQGYETVITHDSLRFSGGQKQRLALVRALYTKPELLILDESTNQQDKELEKKIFNFLKELAATQNTTIIAVSHSKDLDRFFDFTYQIANNQLVAL